MRCLLVCIFCCSDQFSFNIAISVVIGDGTDQLNFWNLAESVTVPHVVFQCAPHILLQSFPFDCLPEISEWIGTPLWKCLASFNFQPEGSTLWLRLVLLLQSNLEDFESFCYGVSHMLLTKAQSFAFLVLIIKAKILFLLQKMTLLNWVCNPPGLVHISCEVVLRRQWIAYRFQLIGETFMKFWDHTSIFFDQCS